MRFGIIEDHRGGWPVSLMCRAFQVSMAGYYAWRKRPESRRVEPRGSPDAAENKALLDAIRQVHAAKAATAVRACMRRCGQEGGGQDAAVWSA